MPWSHSGCRQRVGDVGIGQKWGVLPLFFATVPFYLLAEERGQAIQRELNDSGSFGECYFQVGDVLSEDDIKVGENWEK